MFYIKSYLKNPLIEIGPANDTIQNHDKYFAEIDDIKKIAGFADKLSMDLLYGAVTIKYNNATVLNFDSYDIIDALWTYFIGLIDGMLLDGEANTYFPYQDIEMQLESINEETVCFTLRDNSTSEWEFPKYEFIGAILDSAKHFFNKMTQYFGEDETFKMNRGYINELKKIEELTERIKIKRGN